MSKFLWPAVIAMLVLHQDNWFWNDGTLVFGFIPVGLFYHACLSLVAGVMWFLATKYCWPTGLEEEVASDVAAKEARS